jgi:hypothetical protein
MTDNTKMFVREHYHDQDAQKVIGKLLQFMKNSPRNTMEINRLTKNITSLKLDNNWRGTAEQFLLHFQEQFRLLDDLVSPAEKMCPRFRRILLEAAVQEMPVLRDITNTDEYHRVVANSKSTNYEQYFNLLLVAAQKYDHNSKNNPHKNKRTIFTHDTDDPSNREYFDTKEGTPHGGIDLPAEELYQIHSTTLGEECPDVSDEFYNIFQAEKRGRQRPNKGPPRRDRPQVDGFVRLPKELWNVISDEFK